MQMHISLRAWVIWFSEYQHYHHHHHQHHHYYRSSKLNNMLFDGRLPLLYSIYYKSQVHAGALFVHIIIIFYKLNSNLDLYWHLNIHFGWIPHWKCTILSFFDPMGACTKKDFFSRDYCSRSKLIHFYFHRNFFSQSFSAVDQSRRILWTFQSNTPYIRNDNGCKNQPPS